MGKIDPYQKRQLSRLQPLRFSYFKNDAKLILNGRRSFWAIRNLASSLRYFTSNPPISQGNLESLVEEQTKKNFEGALPEYEVFRGFFPQGASEIKRRSFYADVPYHFILISNGKFAATLGFEPYFGGILVPQIQGSPGREKALKPIKWPRLLLKIAEKWAIEARIPEISVLPSARNKWPKVANNIKNAKLIYDVTARRSGFKYDDEKRVYCKSL